MRSMDDIFSGQGKVWEPKGIPQGASVYLALRVGGSLTAPFTSHGKVHCAVSGFLGWGQGQADE